MVRWGAPAVSFTPWSLAAALEPTFAQVFARWQAFKADEVEAATQLEREVGGGISARREASDNDVD